MARDPRPDQNAELPPLQVTVVNGDLAFERVPLFVGHYRASRLTGTERVVDTVTGGAMSRSLDLGVYPIHPGTHQIFLNTHVDPLGTWLTPRPEAVIVVGLGQEGALRATELTDSVRQAVIAWCQQTAAAGASVAPVTIGATLIGSGGAGVMPGQAAQLIAQAVVDANGRLWAHWPRLPIVGALRLVELYLERASDAWRALKMQAAAAPSRFVVTEPITAGTGPLRRPLESGYRGAAYDYITVHARKNDGARTGDDVVIEYALDTARARTEVRAQTTQLALVRDLVGAAADGHATGANVGRTLYKLLVPVELDSFLAGATETQIELDEITAAIPWELLDGRDELSPAELPWAIRAKLLRKFKTSEFREHVLDADPHAALLVIGEPATDDQVRLPGAYREAIAVHRRLRDKGTFDVHGLFADSEEGSGPDATAVVGALMARAWRVIHIAGHGKPSSPHGGPGGVMLSGSGFLGPREIRAMRQVPELVFINCCHLGAIADIRSTETSAVRTPVAFAASVAQALIDLGVRAVVAAGWAVQDDEARTFAETFYAALLDGARFVDAIAAAREATYTQGQCEGTGGDTWAAYQCYGDPEWRLRRDRSAETAVRSEDDEFASVGSLEGLRLALEMLIVETTYQRRSASQQRTRVARLESRWDDMAWTAGQGIGELFARAYAAAGDFDAAIRWYEQVVDDPIGGPSFDAIEQCANLRIRRAWQSIASLLTRRDADAASLAADTGLAQARDDIATEISVLKRLLQFGSTAERSSLLGSAHKRVALIARLSNDADGEREALDAMHTHYRAALAICQTHDIAGAFYPALNLLAVEEARRANEERRTKNEARNVERFNVERNAERNAERNDEPNGERRQERHAAPVVDVEQLFADAAASLEARRDTRSDFWSVVGELDLTLFRAMHDGALAARAATLIAGYENLATRVQARREWASVADTHEFVLPAYATHASADNAAAARAVLDTLHRLAETATGR